MNDELMNLGRAVMILINYLVNAIRLAGVDDHGNHNNDTPLVYTPEEVADKLGVSKDLVYKKLIPQSGFPIRRVGKRILIPAEQFRQWINEQ